MQYLSDTALKIEFKVHVKSGDFVCKNKIRDEMKTQFRACHWVKTDKTVEP